MKKKKTISAALATALALTCMGSGGGTAFAVPLSDADLQTLITPEILRKLVEGLR